MHEKTSSTGRAMEELDKYLSGELPEEERQSFEQQLAGDRSLQMELQLREGLRQMHWQKRINQATTIRMQPQKAGLKKLFGYTLGLMICLIVVFAVYKKSTSQQKTENNSEPGLQKQLVPRIEDNQRTRKTPSSKQKPLTRGPIAEDRVIDQFDTEPTPGMRSVYLELDPLTQEVLDSLFTKTLQLRPTQSDKNWTKALDLLIEGKVQSAKSYIFALEKTNARAANWLLTLAFLGEGRSEEAQKMLQEISKEPNHPYARVAERALELLEQ